jgi:hypothetical protein
MKKPRYGGVFLSEPGASALELLLVILTPPVCRFCR